MPQFLFSLNYSWIHPLILQVPSLLKRWKTSKRSSTTLRYNHGPLQTMFSNPLIKVRFSRLLGERKARITLCQYFDFDHVFLFVKARYQNAEEVLKQR